MLINKSLSNLRRCGLQKDIRLIVDGQEGEVKLKKLIPRINKISNNELLRTAKNSKRMKVGEMYLSEGCELVEKGKREGLMLLAEKTG